MLASRTETLQSPDNRELVISVDFDGCIFHLGYISSQSPNRLIETNEMFIQHVVDLIKQGKYSHVSFMVGSNRQSKFIDDRNSGNKGSCFPALQQLCDEIQRRTNVPCEVDGYLLADTYGNVKPGENFAWAVNKKNDAPFTDFVWDERKYSIAYAQMHKKASECRGKSVDYHFYDDREDDILFSLLDFYNQNKILMPANLCARFYKYNGKELREFSYTCFEKKYHFELPGEGIIDDFYHENIKQMARSAGLDPDKPFLSHYGEEGISRSLYGERLMNFINERKLRARDICTELNHEISILEKATRLGYEKNDYQQFVSAVRELCAQICKEVDYMEKHARPDDETTASEAVITARATIKAIRAFLEGNIVYTDLFNYQRNKDLVNYVNQFGKPLDFFRASTRLIATSLSGMFYKPSRVAVAAYAVAEKIKPLLAADDDEHEALKEKDEKKRGVAESLSKQTLTLTTPNLL